MSRILVTKDFGKPPSAAPGEEIIPFQVLKEWVKSGAYFRRVFRYPSSALLVGNVDGLSKPGLSLLLVRLLARGPCTLEDARGHKQPVTAGRILGCFLRLLRDRLALPLDLRAIRKEATALGASSAPRGAGLHLADRPVYLRTDVSYGMVSGGSVGHIAGVLNNLDAFGGPAIFLSSDVIPTVREDIETAILRPLPRYPDFNELPSLVYNRDFYARAEAILAGRKLSFIYQRYSLNNYSGIKLARRFNLPFVLEYNGSEIWISRNWGKPFKYEKLAVEIETRNLEAADLIVVVSRPMADELAQRGIPRAKILVNPNGVNPSGYRPDLDGSAIRKRHGLEGKTVVGFIGTFGPWHGAEVLADAFGKLLGSRPALRDSVRLLLIGDGTKMPQVRAALKQHAVEAEAVLTGTVPQKEGPSHLAACDLLISPHVPNPDGTPFFGSPTKLFEYMAMGRGIVASDLDQIGEILEHDKTAWMCRPGDVGSLMEGMAVLLEDPARRERLGRAARQEVVAKYTWREHTRKIVERLKELRGQG